MTSRDSLKHQTIALDIAHCHHFQVDVVDNIFVGMVVGGASMPCEKGFAEGEAPR